MDKPEKIRPSNSSDTFVGLTASAFDALDSPGHHGVRIFGLPRNQLIMAIVASMLFMLPLAILIGMIPLWERVGELFVLKKFNSLIAPAVENLSYDRAERFPLKRFLISCISMVELIFLSNAIALFARGVRKRGLLVWTCYDRTKLLQCSGVSALIFFGLWFVLFFDWTILDTLTSTRRGGRVIIYSMMGMPFVAFVFGHLAAIVGLGCWRSISRKLRRPRKPVA